MVSGADQTIAASLTFQDIGESINLQKDRGVRIVPSREIDRGMCTHTHTYAFIYVCVYTYVFMHVCMVYVCVCVHAGMYVCVCVCVCVYVRIC